jgi:hypothetical protein
MADKLTIENQELQKLSEKSKRGWPAECILSCCVLENSKVMSARSLWYSRQVPILKRAIFLAEFDMDFHLG